MGDKIKSKDLSYDAALPPFLQRLRGQHTGLGDADRHERPLARPRKAKEHDDEDGPVVVDEHGETMTEKELVQRNAAEKAKAGEAIPETEPELAPSHTHRAETIVTAGTVTNKRKAAKIVGEDEPDQNVDASPAATSSSKAIKKVKRKAKAIKLAFDDDDG